MSLVDESPVYEALMLPGDPHDLVAAIFRRPDWMAEAGCINLGSEKFVPAPARPNKPPTLLEQAALSVCRTCPVREECLDYALQHGELGVWGGTTERERSGGRPGR